MNPEQWQSLVRALLQIALAPGSYLVLHGIVPADQAPQLVPALTVLITGLGGALLAKWGVSAHSANAITLAVNSDSAPGVKVVPVTSASPAVILAPTGEIRPAPAPIITPPEKKASKG